MEMSSEEGFVINVEPGQYICNPVHYNTNQSVRKQGILGKLKLLLSAVRIIRKLKLLLGVVFSIEEEAVDKEGLHRDGKTSLLISGVIMSANYTAITSLPSSSENRGDEGVRQGVLIPSILSLITTLLVMAVQVDMPTFNLRRVKMVVPLCIIFTAYSFMDFVAMILGSISQGTVVTILIAAVYMFFIAIVLLYPKFRTKTPQALG